METNKSNMTKCKICGADMSISAKNCPNCGAPTNCKKINNKMIPCKSCGKDISVMAKTCPHCGAPAEKPPYKKAWFWIAVVMSLMCYYAIALQNKQTELEEQIAATETTIPETTIAETEPPITEEETIEETQADLTDMSDYEGKAYVIATEIVKECLVSPKSADFCKMWECKMQRYDQMFAVQGYVDAQNRFGAMIRTPFTVQFFILDPSTYYYKVSYINLDGEVSGEWLDFPQ